MLKLTLRFVGNLNRFVDGGARGTLGVRASGEGTWIRRLQLG